MASLVNQALGSYSHYVMAGINNARATPKFNHHPQTLQTVSSSWITYLMMKDRYTVENSLIAGTIGGVALLILVGNSFGSCQKIHLKGYGVKILRSTLLFFLGKRVNEIVPPVIFNPVVCGSATFALENLKRAIHPEYDPTPQAVFVFFRTLFLSVKKPTGVEDLEQQFTTLIPSERGRKCVVVIGQVALALGVTSCFCSLTGRVFPLCIEETLSHALTPIIRSGLIESLIR